MNPHRAKKRFGQHFLRDRSIIEKILQAVDITAGERLVEIGPGLGAMTGPLLEAGARLHCIEIDRDAVAELRKRFGQLDSITIHSADVLKFDFSRLAQGSEIRLVGNLPYNISTPLLFHLLESKNIIADMHFMLQREVVERICAQPGEPAYGRLSVMLACHFQAENLFTIEPEAFRPPPKVESAFLRLVPHATPPFEIHDPKLFADIVRSAFSQRRKTVRNSLRRLADARLLEKCGIDPGLRAECVAAAQFAALANTLCGHSESVPKSGL